MSHNHKTLISKIALATFVGIITTSAIPMGNHSASAAPIVASVNSKTAPGQPKFGESGPAVVAVQTAILRQGFTLRGGATGNFDNTCNSEKVGNSSGISDKIMFSLQTFN